MTVGQGQGTQVSDDDFDDEDEGKEGDKDESGTESGGESFDKDRALATIKKQRASEKALKDSLKELKKEINDLKSKDLPDSEKLQGQVAEAQERATKAEAALQKAAVRTAALEEAVTLGFRSPTLAFKLIDVDEVDWDGDQPSNIKELLKDLLKSDPYLKGGRRRNTDGRGAEGDEDEDEEDANAGQGRGRRSKGSGVSMNDQIRRAAGR